MLSLLTKILKSSKPNPSRTRTNPTEKSQIQRSNSKHIFEPSDIPTPPKRTDRLSNLELLLVDYEQARDDERQLEGVQVALLGMLIAAYVAMLTLLNKIGETIPSGFSPETTTLRYSLVAIYALAPLIVFLPTALAQFVASRATIRSFYIRGLEHEIRAEWEKMSNEKPTISAEQVLSYPAYSLIELLVEQGTMARGANRGHYFLISIVISYAVAVILTIGASITGLWSLANPYIAITVGAIYVFFSLILGADAYRTNHDGHSFFLRTVQNAEQRFRTGRPKNSDQQYNLWLPRPDDLSKSIFEITGIVTGMILSSQFNWRTLGISLAMIAAFELIFYQGRYIVNDLIEARCEPEANLKEYRGRLSRKDPRMVGLALISLAVRALLTIFLTIFVFNHISWSAATILLLSSGSIVIITVIYELARSRSRNSASPRCGIHCFLTYATVPLAYPVRFILGGYIYLTFLNPTPPTGIAAALDNAFHPLLALEPELVTQIFTLLWWSFGTGLCFVSLTWALEGIDFGHPENSRGSRLFASINEKPHVWYATQRLFAPITTLTPEILSDCASYRYVSRQRNRETLLGQRPSELAGGIKDKKHARETVSLNNIFTPWTIGGLISFTTVLIWINGQQFLTLSLLGGPILAIFSHLFCRAIVFTHRLQQVCYATLFIFASVLSTLPALDGLLFERSGINISIAELTTAYLLLILGSPIWIIFFANTDYRSTRNVLKSALATLIVFIQPDPKRLGAHFLRNRPLGRNGRKTEGRNDLREYGRQISTTVQTDHHW